MMEYLERLVREWYEYQGYFVRDDLWVGLETDGSYECDLAVVAFHPTRRHVVHVEPSFDLLSWEEREQHFQTKFDAAGKYLHRIFGTEPHLHIEHVALIVSNDRPRAHTIGGGRMLLLCDFFAEIVQHLGRLDMAAAVVPDQWGLIRTLQFVAAYRERLVPLLAALTTGESAPSGAEVAGTRSPRITDKALRHSGQG
jgi:hypothetical protein